MMGSSELSFIFETPRTKLGENLADSGYEGLHSTPRYFKPREIRKTRLQFSADKKRRIREQIAQFYLKLLPFSIPTILIFSVLFGSFIGRDIESRNRNMK